MELCSCRPCRPCIRNYHRLDNWLSKGWCIHEVMLMLPNFEKSYHFWAYVRTCIDYVCTSPSKVFVNKLSCVYIVIYVCTCIMYIIRSIILHADCWVMPFTCVTYISSVMVTLTFMTWIDLNKEPERSVDFETTGNL